MAPQPTPGAPSSRQPLVLIVDDHEDSREMYACGLLAMGFDAVTADTAEDAFARTCELRPDVIVADISLPGPSGLDLTRRLRQDSRTEDLRIIVLTGHAGAFFEREAYHAGCDRFLAKPCLPDTLALEIWNVLRPGGTTAYHQAFDRIRAEYQEMPGMQLTLQQVERLSGVEASTCRLVLDDLVRAKFLRKETDGTYRRTTTDTVRDPVSRPPAADDHADRRRLGQLRRPA